MKKQAAMIAICAALLICVATAGCAASSSSPTASATAHASSKAAAASATVTPTPSASAGGSASLSVLFFYKPTCPYCQALENTTSFQQLQKKVNVQWIVSNQSFRTDQYNVTGVPTLILLNHGTEIGRWVDPTDASAINAQIDSLLAAG
ncbi:MAG: thioredoxin family protein [Halobacteriota archaeon]|jgi:thiol-disulfide isomerase/thioredoxin